jgi:tetratricopeptide (TPR) repeat protein
MTTTRRTSVPPYLGYSAIVFFILIGCLARMCITTDQTLSLALIDNGETGEARNLLEGSIRRSASSSRRADLYWCLSLVEMREGRPAAALEQLERAAAEQPTAVRHHVRLAEHYDVFCQPLDAMRCLEKAVTVYRDWRKNGRQDIANQAGQIIRLAPNELATPQVLNERFDEWMAPWRRRLAWYQRWYQKLDDALVTHRELAADYPKDFDTLGLLQRLESYAGHDRESEVILQQMKKLRPTATDIREMLSFRYQWNRQPRKALEELRLENLTRDEARRRILMAYVEAGLPREGVAEYLRRFPNDRDPLALKLLLGSLLAAEGDVRTAQEVLEEVASEYPTNVTCRERLAQLHNARGTYAVAAKYYIELSELKAENAYYARQAVRSLDAAGSFDAALARFQHLQSLNPKDRELRRELGLRLTQSERFSEAEPYLKQAYKDFPKDEEVIYSLARCRSGLGRFAEALPLYDQVYSMKGVSSPPRDAAVVSPPAVATLSVTASAAATASTTATIEGPIRRRVLVIYKKGEGETPEDNWTSAAMESVLNHLGLVADYRAAEEPLLTHESMRPYCGVITWFHSPKLQNAEAFVNWLALQPAQRRPVVVFDTMGWTTDTRTGKPVSQAALEKLYNAIGIRMTGGWTDVPSNIEVLKMDSGMCEFERPFAYERDYLMGVQSIDPRNHVYLQLRRKDKPSLTSDAIVVGPNGAFCLESYSLRYDAERSRYQWRLNPFRFLGEALGLDGSPRMDYVTRDGCRIFYSHVDGDGSERACFWKPLVICSEEYYTHIVQKRNYPVTVSFVGALIDPALFVDHASIETAKKTLAHPNVEAAHHSYAHPMDWRGTTLAINVPGYLRFDPQQEIVGAKKLVEKVACPPDKPVRMLLWSGLANPDRACLQMAESAGLLTMNGGGKSRCDPSYPSIAHLAPLHRYVDGKLLPLNSVASDTHFAEMDALPPSSYRNVIETFKGTESPRRLAPIDLYVHFSRMEFIEGISALDEVYNWIEKQVLHPISVSDYVRIGLGFRAARITRLSADSWEIAQHGQCRTVRFDGEERAVDLPASRGVRGYNRANGALYVHLDGEGPAVIKLARIGNDVPFLVQSTEELTVFAVQKSQVSFNVTSPRDAVVTLGGFPPASPVTLETRLDQNAASPSRIRNVTDTHGQVTFTIPVAGTRLVTVFPERTK